MHFSIFSLHLCVSIALTRRPSVIKYLDINANARISEILINIEELLINSMLKFRFRISDVASS